MLATGNKGRLEQEIATLIGFIAEGRAFFFAKTGFSVESSDGFLNHFVSKEVLNGNVELNQLQLNIQLLYIKLSSYYKLLANSKEKGIRKPRNVFAHDLTDMVFGERVNYNFFLHKVSENFKRVQYVFYDENGMETFPPNVKSFDLELDKDIKDFLSIWSNAEV
ncbi:MAG: hypothetical protein WCW14_04140 [Candidatus Paceibacterota bacterium]|jgi:hypothetical protein